MYFTVYLFEVYLFIYSEDELDLRSCSQFMEMKIDQNNNVWETTLNAQSWQA